ncbi:MAG: GDSL-type esterase/lipase family protein [Pseudomonadota bacterium]
MRAAFFKPLLLALALALASGPLGAQPTPPVSRPDASAALQKQDTGVFMARHESFLARARGGPIGLLFLGDSITERWQRAPHIWQAYFGQYQPANFGIGGDRTQHLLWRIEQGELDGIAPKVVVLMIGTNNSHDYNAGEIAAADRKIVALIRARLPQTRILLLGIFPRGPRPDKAGAVTQAAIDDAARRKLTIDAVNRELAGLDDGKMVRFLDLGAVFLGQDGRIPWSIMPDQLHPAPAGYQLWADAMQPLLEAMMK